MVQTLICVLDAVLRMDFLEVFELYPEGIDELVDVSGHEDCYQEAHISKLVCCGVLVILFLH